MEKYSFCTQPERYAYGGSGGAAASGFSKRDPRDVLVLPEGASELDKSKPLGCSSLRRTLQLKKLYPDMDVRSIRGNLQTRLRKLDEGQYSALILAAAGLKRLGLESRINRYFTADEIIPAAGQGILAVQGRKGKLMISWRATVIRMPGPREGYGACFCKAPGWRGALLRWLPMRRFSG